jgi:hypothetical protein
MRAKHLTAIVFVLAAALLSLGKAATADDDLIEPNINRIGGDIRSLDVATQAACEVACGNQGGCRSWTYVKPGVQGPKAKCWLKKGFPTPRADNCCVSGVKWGIEPDINRVGSDYRSFEIGNADLRDKPEEVCQLACWKERKCEGWTYVRPGVQGPKAKCWLKTAFPAPRADKCCISGPRGSRLP